jgi:hypothetical protein
MHEDPTPGELLEFGAIVLRVWLAFPDSSARKLREIVILGDPNAPSLQHLAVARIADESDWSPDPIESLYACFAACNDEGISVSRQANPFKLLFDGVGCSWGIGE